MKRSGDDRSKRVVTSGDDHVHLPAVLWQHLVEDVGLQVVHVRDSLTRVEAASRCVGCPAPVGQEGLAALGRMAGPGPEERAHSIRQRQAMTQAKAWEPAGRPYGR